LFFAVRREELPIMDPNTVAKKEANETIKPPSPPNLTSRSLIKPPNQNDIEDIARTFNITLEEKSVQSYLDLVKATLAPYEVLAASADNIPLVKYPRTPGYRPRAEENKYNAWYYKTNIKGAENGKLKGKTVVLKDNVCLSGVPMMNGSKTVEGYVPDVDATVVQRILDAGATIVGKAHCEDLCFSGGSHTNATGPVHNPNKHGYSSGGSSSGSAVLVAAKEVDMAIACDQGGSIRIPSSFCGVYGMKPTFGLVPYTGIFSIESTIDHVGPVTNNVTDNALFLEVLAGPDDFDFRQRIPHHVKFDYTKDLELGVKGLKIGIVKEGFELANSEDVVNQAVRNAAKSFATLGAEVTEISIPEHKTLAVPIWLSIALEGFTDQMIKGFSEGSGHKGLYVTSLIDAYRNGLMTNANQLADSVKVNLFAGEYIQRQYGRHYYAKSQNLNRLLTAAYDKALSQYDVLIMPTLPLRATKIPGPEIPREEWIARAFEMIPNTAPFDVTGHPAMTVPCGKHEDLPIGMMIISKHFAESTIYKVARAYEKNSPHK